MAKLAEETRFKKSSAGKVPAGSRKSSAALCFGLSFVSLTTLKWAEGVGVLTGDQHKPLNNFMTICIVLCVENGKEKNREEQLKHTHPPPMANGPLIHKFLSPQTFPTLAAYE